MGSSVASFLVRRGGGQAPQMYRQKKICNLYARGSASKTYIFQVSKYICIHTINAVPFYYLWHGAIIMTKQYSLRKIYEYASELRKFSHFHILKLLFPSIFCWYLIWYFVSEKFSGLKLHLHILYNKYSFLLLLMVWHYVYKKHTNIVKIYVYASERNERA